MALIIEDGTGVVNANSYVSEEEATVYLELRGREDWPTDQLSQMRYLVRAGDYLNTFYGWGAPLTDHQQMALPTEAVPYVPSAVKTAQILLAYEASKGELAEGAISGAPIVKERKKLDGVGEKEVEYSEEAPYGGRRFPAIDALLAGFTIATNTSGTGGSIQVARRLVG